MFYGRKFINSFKNDDHWVLFMHSSSLFSFSFDCNEKELAIFSIAGTMSQLNLTSIHLLLILSKKRVLARVKKKKLEEAYSRKFCRIAIVYRKDCHKRDIKD